MAIEKLLEYAEAMSFPGEIIFIDSEEYTWLLEDKDFSANFIQRIETLLRNGFKIKFVIHYSSYKQPFVSLFNICSPYFSIEMLNGTVMNTMTKAYIIFHSLF